jgi:hypothetical protein
MLIIKPTKLGAIVNFHGCGCLARLPNLLTSFRVETRHTSRTFRVHAALALIFARRTGIDNARTAEETTLVSTGSIGITCLIWGAFGTQPTRTGLQTLLRGIHERSTAIHIVGSVAIGG